MVDPPRRSLPSSAGDVQLRRLGRGKGNGDSPLRGQVVVALVLVMIVLGVPLYLMRHPTLQKQPAAAASASAQAASAKVVRTEIDAGVSKPRLQLDQIQRLKCSSAPSRRGNEGPQCDPLPQVEDLFKKAIRSELDCSPNAGAGSINYVLNVDFNRRSLNVFPGQSGEWKGPQAKRSAECIERAMGVIEWATLSHRYRYYSFAILAHYAAPTALDIVPSFE